MLLTYLHILIFFLLYFVIAICRRCYATLHAVILLLTYILRSASVQCSRVPSQRGHAPPGYDVMYYVVQCMCSIDHAPPGYDVMYYVVQCMM
jgi:hypothetical protein